MLLDLEVMHEAAHTVVGAAAGFPVLGVRPTYTEVDLGYGKPGAAKVAVLLAGYLANPRRAAPCGTAGAAPQTTSRRRSSS